MKISKSKLIIFLTLFLFSLLIRLFSLRLSPPSLNWDEVSLGYNAYSIIKTAKDEWGRQLPLIFRAYGDYKLPLYIYLTAPFTLFGLNFITVKLVSLIAGSLLPYIVYLIVRHLLPDSKYIPLLAASLIILSPWSIYLSTIALEANLFLTLFMLSFYFLITQRISYSLILFSLSLFSYNSSRVLLPFYLLLVVFISQKFKLKVSKISIIVFLISFGLFVYQSFFSESGQARYQWVSLIDQGTVNRIEERRNQSHLPSAVSRLIHNKITYFAAYSAKNYSYFFNPAYMFFKTGSHFQFNLPNLPMFTPLLVIFYYAGILSLLYQLIVKKRFNYLLIFILFLISPIPSAVTRDAPHILRSIVFYPTVAIIISLGFSVIQNFTRSHHHSTLNLLFFLIILTSTISYFRFLPFYSKNYSFAWQYGYQQVVDYVNSNSSKYDQIFFTKRYGEPHEFILFFSQYSPALYQNNFTKNWNYHAQWYWIDGFDKYEFLNDWEVKKFTSNPSHKTLLVTTPGNFDSSIYQKLTTIYYPDGQPVFDIVSHD